MKIIFLASFLFISITGLANTYEINAGDPNAKILIESEQAQIEVIGRSDNAQNKTTLNLDRASEGLVEVLMPEAGTTNPVIIRDKATRASLKLHVGKAEKGKAESSEKNQVHIEISGNSLPLEIHLQEGGVDLKNWQRDTYVHLQKGKLVSVGGQSSLSAHLQKGELSVQNHTGKIIVDSLQCNANLKDVNGDVEVQNFMGDWSFDHVTGALSLNLNQGSTKLINGSGSVQFELQKANLSTFQFEGRIEGLLSEGSVSVQASQDPEVSIKSQSGKVMISTQAASGALLNISTSAGDVSVPSYLKLSRDGSNKSLRARLKGESQKGSIFVRSQEGAIVIR